MLRASIVPIALLVLAPTVLASQSLSGSSDDCDLLVPLLGHRSGSRGSCSVEYVASFEKTCDAAGCSLDFTTSIVGEGPLGETTRVYQAVGIIQGSISFAAPLCDAYTVSSMPSTDPRSCAAQTTVETDVAAGACLQSWIRTNYQTRLNVQGQPVTWYVVDLLQPLSLCNPGS